MCHGLHMRRGSTVIEVRNPRFDHGAPRPFAEQSRRWVTGSTHSGPVATAPLVYRVLTLADNCTVPDAQYDACARKYAQAIAKWPSRAKAWAARGNWSCAWNADVRVDWPLLRAELQAVAERMARHVENSPTTS